MTGRTGAGDVPREFRAGPSGWRGADLRATDEWLLRLSPRQLAELSEALSTARRRGVTLLRLTVADFPLPTLAGELERIGDVLEHGRGFVLIRGIPVDRLSEAAASAVFWGLGQYLGRPVSQNADGHVLGHVRDTGRTMADPATRGYQTRAALPFHTDAADLLALLCLRAARSGGRTSLVSSAAVHDAVLKFRPDLAERLRRTHYFDRREEHAPGEPPYLAAPLTARSAGRPSLRYHRCYLESAQRFPDVPRLEPADLELFDLIDELAGSPEFRLDIDLEPGDLLLFNNHATLHARSEFEDFDAPEFKRHLLRLWLAFGDCRGPDAARHGVAPRDVVRPRSPLTTRQFQAAVAAVSGAAPVAHTKPRRLPT
ncbi:TauD/TfdA family dioxygenase [Streptomyces sp. NPDC001530]|uniref:TauD/TfdA family dioxygenase n=1 Tax=Streptomyces sp. NPDC001530 TaxID=3364582 RepID=UPI00367B9208